MNTTETDLSAPPTPPAERQHADRGEWGRVRIPGGQQGRPHSHTANQPASSDDAVELDAFDDFNVYDQTTSG